MANADPIPTPPIPTPPNPDDPNLAIEAGIANPLDEADHSAESIERLSSSGSVLPFKAILLCIVVVGGGSWGLYYLTTFVTAERSKLLANGGVESESDVPLQPINDVNSQPANLRSPAPQPPKASSDNNASAANNAEQLATLERISLARSRVIPLYSLGETAQGNLTQLETEVTAWRIKVDSLLTGEQGKKIAASPSHVEKFLALYEQPRDAMKDVAKKRQQLEGLLRPITLAYHNESSQYTPSPELQQDLQAVHLSIEQSLKSYKEQRLIRETLFEDVAQTVSSKSTLQEAMDAVRKQRIQKRSQKIAQARQQALDEGTRKVAAAEAKKATAEEELKAAKIDRETAEVARQKQALDAAEAEIIKQAELARKKVQLRKEATQPEVLKLLAPFTTPAFSQIRAVIGLNVHATTTTTKKPLSWTALRTSGALKGDRDGMLKLVAICTSSGPLKDRPRWIGMMVGPSLTTGQIEMIGKVQQHLTKYGETLAEAGLLSP